MQQEKNIQAQTGADQEPQSQGMISPPIKAARKDWDKQQWGSRQENVRDRDSECQWEMWVSAELRFKIYGSVKEISQPLRGRLPTWWGDHRGHHLLWWLLFSHQHEFTSPGFKFIHVTYLMVISAVPLAKWMMAPRFELFHPQLW